MFGERVIKMTIRQVVDDPVMQLSIDRIKKWDDKILKTVCEPITSELQARSIIQEMRDVLAGIRKVCVGLAAPQIGWPVRIIAVCPNSTLPISFLINPEIVWRADEKISDIEGCMSFPGVKTNVERHRSVKVKFLNYRMKEQTSLFTMYDARIVQHEIDHLNGICLVGNAWNKELE